MELTPSMAATDSAVHFARIMVVSSRHAALHHFIGCASLALPLKTLKGAYLFRADAIYPSKNKM
jgi:hypothetical protein